VVIVWMVLGPLMEPKREKKVVAIIPNAFLTSLPSFSSLPTPRRSSMILCFIFDILPGVTTAVRYSQPTVLTQEVLEAGTEFHTQCRCHIHLSSAPPVGFQPRRSCPVPTPAGRSSHGFAACSALFLHGLNLLPRSLPPSSLLPSPANTCCFYYSSKSFFSWGWQK
jgi:hypothetical protein